MVEFVVREGPMFEAMIMNRELNNPMFKFLFENQSPAHVYYRWKLFSILNGDLPYKWRTEEFRMFRGGSYWKPPVMNPYTQGMPDDLVEGGVEIPVVPKVEEEVVPQQKKGKLTDSQRDRLEDMLRELSPERTKIGEAMVWCMDHAESAEEVVECIAESLSILQTPIPKKIARLFLVSDILFNSSAKVPNASFYRKHFQRKLKEIFRDVHETYDNIDGRLKAEQFKQKVMLCFRAWEDWAVYPNDYLINLQNIFLGLVPKAEKVEEVPESLDLDGAPLEDPDLDGAPLMLPVYPQEEERNGDKMVMKVIKEESDLDGMPLGEDLDGEPINDSLNEEIAVEKKQEPPKFVTSKWETIDETELEAQAMTTSKWDLLGEDDGKTSEGEDVDGQPLPEEDVDGREMSEEEGLIEDSVSPSRDSRHDRTPRSGEMSEERRQKLREIEVKVMKYQDELEAGKRSRKSNMTLTQQVEHHRKKLLAKELSDSPLHEQQEMRKRHRSISPQYRGYDDSPKRRKRSKSPKRRRSRSRSPRRRSSSRSPSRHRRKSKKNKRKD